MPYPTHPFDLFLEDMRAARAARPRDLGTAFERLVKDFLLTDSTQKSRYARVMSYAQWAITALMVKILALIWWLSGIPVAG